MSFPEFHVLAAMWLRVYVVDQFQLAWPMLDFEGEFATDGEVLARYEAQAAALDNWRAAMGVRRG